MLTSRLHRTSTIRHPPIRPVELLCALLLAAPAAIAACSGDRDPPGGAGLAPPATTSTTSSSTTGPIGGGGSGTGTSSAGSSAAGGEGGSGLLPPDDPCLVDAAWGASSLAFVAPTPAGLASALNTLSYEYRSDPRALTVVLVASHGIEGATLSVSATADNGSYQQAFPPGLVPSSTGVELGHGRLLSASTQDVGYLRLVDANGVLDVELNNLYLEAATTSGCGALFSVLDAAIPASQADVVLTVGPTSATLAELAAQGAGGSGGDSGLGWQLRAYLQAEAVPFDYSSAAD